MDYTCYSRFTLEGNTHDVCGNGGADFTTRFNQKIMIIQLLELAFFIVGVLTTARYVIDKIMNKQ
jgi:hypothetical protein